MRHVFVFVLVSAISVFAFTNLSLTPDTISLGETMLLKGDFSAPGDSADIFLYCDVDENGAFEEKIDLAVFSTIDEGTKYVDGKDDMDTVADGKTEGLIKTGDQSGFSFEGLYTMIIWDKGGADTASVRIKPWPATNTKISGKVTGPNGGALKNILVFSSVELSGNRLQDRKKTFFHHTALFSRNARPNQIRRSARTNATGDYTIYYPDSTQSKKVFIMAMDEFKVYRDSFFVPPQAVDTLLIANLTGINFMFKKATQFIAGIVKDEKGTVIYNARLTFENREANLYVPVETDSGKYIVPVIPGAWEIWFDDWGIEESYMHPQAKIDVLSSNDTVKYNYVLYTTNSFVKGVIYDSAGINLEKGFSINLSVDTTGVWDWDKGAWYYADAKVIGDTAFTVSVNSKFKRYMFHVWVDDEILPQGYFVTPTNIDSVGPGQAGIIIKIQKGDKFIRLKVVDEDSTVEPNVDVKLRDDQLNVEVPGKTDGNGIALIQISTGNWRVRVDNDNYLNQDFNIKVEQNDDTVSASYLVISTDATIKGTVTGAISNIKDLMVIAGAYHDSLDATFYTMTTVGARAPFSLKVSSSARLSKYRVEVANWKLPEGYAVSPQFYENVTVGTDSLLFQVLAPGGSISGKITMTLPQFFDAGVTAIDSIRFFALYTEMQNNKTYSMKVPNGVYTVVGGFIAPTDTLLYRVDSIVVNNNDVIINFSDSGAQVIPIIFTPVVDKIAFNLKSFPNPFRGYTNISFSTPIQGKARLMLYDLNGKLLMTLYSGEVEKGHYSCRLYMDKLNNKIKSGYLIARLTVKGEKVYTKNIRLVHVK